MRATRRAYIFDIDGTIANGAHRLHHIEKTPKDWSAFFAACGGDQPIPHIIQLANHLNVTGVAIVYVSGRSDECRDATQMWLHEHKLPDGPLYMRRAGDHRNDDILKVEMLAEVRSHGYEILMAFDDRSRVVRAWRAAGVPCAQVAEGEF